MRSASSVHTMNVNLFMFELVITSYISAIIFACVEFNGSPHCVACFNFIHHLINDMRTWFTTKALVTPSYDVVRCRGKILDIVVLKQNWQKSTFASFPQIK